jgi:hypothetical protein
LALDGKFVTRVIYLENPRDALPVRDNLQGLAWFEAAPGQDPLAVADALGRPVAILRLGARLPDQAETPDANFFYCSPPFVPYPPQRPVSPQVKILPPPPKMAPAPTASKEPAPEGPKP